MPLLAQATKKAGERLLIVSADAEQLDAIDRELWEQKPEAFLAHGRAGEPHSARQPALLASEIATENSARYLILADGVWREGAGCFERVFFLFGDATLERARSCWRALDGREGLERNFWKQEEGRWNKQA